jgi:hypothetical protein
MGFVGGFMMELTLERSQRTFLERSFYRPFLLALFDHLVIKLFMNLFVNSSVSSLVDNGFVVSYCTLIKYMFNLLHTPFFEMESFHTHTRLS